MRKLTSSRFQVPGSGFVFRFDVQRSRFCVRATALIGALLFVPTLAAAQVLESITFDEAVRRAVTNHPTVRQAAAAVVRSEAVLQQVRSRSRPSVDATFSTNVIDPVTSFGGESIVPRTQTLSTAALAVPLFTPVSWAERNQAADQVAVSERVRADARRAIATAAGQAYLAVIAARRVVELNERARDTARAHYDYANQRFQGGIGSRLNALRAQQELSGTDARVEEARLALRRAQEALGVLIASDGPVDAAAEPAFELPPETAIDAELVAGRQDVQLIASREAAARRVAGDAWKDRLPSATALVTPQALAPAGLFADQRSWRASFLFSVPIFDSGERAGRAREREALVVDVRAEREDVERRAASEIRAAREAVLATERARDHARQAAQQAGEVLQITDIAFREGATTNIEVIDAQRRARDAETAAAMADDAVRQSRLELLLAAGRFP
jgi:outer membrane protein TolC